MQGPDSSAVQTSINKILLDFYTVARNKQTTAKDHESFLLNLENLIKQSGHAAQLTLNPQISQEDNQNYSLLLEKHKLGAINQELNRIAKKYNCLPFAVSSFRAEINEENLDVDSDSEPNIPDMESFHEENLLNPPIPHTFKEQGTDLIDEYNTRYTFVASLSDRGQGAQAGFYANVASNDDKQILIKRDKVALNVLEGSAYYAQTTGLLPRNLERAANFARVGTIQTESAKAPIAITVQPRLTPTNKDLKIKAWPQEILGRSRNPKTLYSEESWHAGAIIRNVHRLNSSPQWELAGGIFYSQMVGDESMHIGQFMVEVDAQGIIHHVCRIDLGARERFAVEREAKQQHSPYATSALYSQSGQWKKDYSGFLLEERDLLFKVTLLWARLAAIYSEGDIHTLVKRQTHAAIAAELKQLSPELQNEAINGILAIINQGATTPFKIDPTSKDKIKDLADKLGELDAIRMNAMKKQAVERLQAHQEELTQRVKTLFDNEDADPDLIAHYTIVQQKTLRGDDDIKSVNAISAMLDRKIQKLLDKLKKNPLEERAYQKLEALSQLGAELLEAARLSEMYGSAVKVVLKELETKLNAYKTVYDCAQYCIQTQSTNKRPYVDTIMRKAMKDEVKPYLQEHPDLVATLTAHTSAVGSAQSLMGKKSEGSTLLKTLYKRYGVDLRYLTLTVPQRLLLDYAVKTNNPTPANFRELNSALQSGNYKVEDTLSADPNGSTVLHYLMANADGEQPDSIAAIRWILTHSLGKTSNANLDIVDANGKTPLHILLDNPNAKAIIGKINQEKIPSPLWGKFKMHELFKDKTKYTHNELELAANPDGLSQKHKPRPN